MMASSSPRTRVFLQSILDSLEAELDEQRRELSYSTDLTPRQVSEYRQSIEKMEADIALLVYQLSSTTDDIINTSLEVPFELWAPLTQAEAFEKSPSLPMWEEMNQRAKILSLFSFAQQGAPPAALGIVSDSDPLVASVLTLFQDDMGSKAFRFSRFHNQFQKYVVDRAMLSTDDLDFRPLISNCLPGILTHCEARVWFRHGEPNGPSDRAMRAYCPRANKPCGLDPRAPEPIPELWGARLYPDISLHWRDWSLLELLNSLAIRPAVAELNRSEEYVARLGGWINRLNDIRSALRCSKCGQTMVPNLRYATNLARYNMTIASCQHGVGHDVDIYFNHCWGCRARIDSRMNRFREDDYYLCLVCGCGPQAPSHFRPGDRCPKCGEPKMVKGGEPNKFRCSNVDCHHVIVVPRRVKPTHLP